MGWDYSYFFPDEYCLRIEDVYMDSSELQGLATSLLEHEGPFGMGLYIDSEFGEKRTNEFVN